MSVEDGGLGIARPSGADTFRGVLVIAAAVVVGLVLLSRGLSEDDDVTSAGVQDQTQTVDTAVAGGGAAPPDGTDAATTTTPTTAPPASTTVAPPALRQPSEVRVLVLNGSGRQGVAGRGAQFFENAGYASADPENAPAPGPSAILYVDGYEAEAQAAAAALGVEASVVAPIDPAAPPIDDLEDADLVVVAGTDGVIDF